MEQETWITSDPHINHKNLIKGISNWNDKSGCRPFDNRDEHNWTIINNINKYVKEDHILYVLGDWSFGGISSSWWFRKQLNVKDIRFIFGNHDHHIENNKVYDIPKDEEETWNFLKDHKNPVIDFGTLKHMTINNIKQHKPELF